MVTIQYWYSAGLAYAAKGSTPEGDFWVPPLFFAPRDEAIPAHATNRPYWISGQKCTKLHTAGPDLTDAEIEKYIGKDAIHEAQEAQPSTSLQR